MKRAFLLNLLIINFLLRISSMPSSKQRHLTKAKMSQITDFKFSYQLLYPEFYRRAFCFPLFKTNVERPSYCQ